MPSIKLEKSLTEADWKKFAKALPKEIEVDDAALLKALARLDKAAGGGAPDDVLEALEDVDAQLKKQHAIKRKADSRELRKQLDAMQDAVARQRKEAQALKAAADEDEEADSPVLLTTKMVPLIRQLRQGEADGVKMPAMICTAGKGTAVLVMRRSISPSRRKLLSESLDAAGGAKFITGECGYENKTLTFVVKAPGAALAKRLRQALLDQLQLRLKVRVRGEDGTVEEDGEDEGDEAPQATATPQDGSTAEVSPAQRAYEQRLAALEPRLAAARRDGHPELQKMHGVAGFASEKAAAGDFAAATKALQMVEKLLEGAAAAPPRSGLDPGAAFNARLAALMPKVKAAVAAGGARGTQLRDLVARAGERAKAGAHPQAQELLDQVEQALEAPAPRGGPEAAAAFKARVAQVLGELKTAQARRPQDVPAQRQRVMDAMARAQGQDYDAANALLDEVAAWLEQAGEAMPAPGSGPGGIVHLQTSRRAWETMRGRLQKELKALEKAMLAAVRAHNSNADADFGFDEGAVAGAVGRLHGILDKLDTRLITVLDKALDAEGDERARHQLEALELVGEYRRFIDSDPLVAAIDGNGFLPTSIRAEAQRTLAQLAAQL